uniref:Ig-like domain-containing protein n=1 Tax=Falco tinnunculus TaxID=100819 RepID=A0A8C4XMI2_FALTI
MVKKVKVTQGHGDPHVPSPPYRGWRGAGADLCPPDAPQGVQLVVGPGQRVEEKTNITLGCRGAAHPPPELFEWFRDGRSLGQSRKGLWVLPAVGAGPLPHGPMGPPAPWDPDLRPSPPLFPSPAPQIPPPPSSDGPSWPWLRGSAPSWRWLPWG